MRRSRLLLVAVSCALVAACSWKPGFINEYKIDIQQGNVLTQEMVSQLKPGQTKDQVRFILGTPVLADVFHANRWDYVYRLQKGSTGLVEERKFTVIFDADGKLARVAGDVTAAQESAAAAAPVASTREIDLGSIDADAVAPPIEEKGFFGKMMESVGF